jgi:hypothetical protein
VEGGGAAPAAPRRQSRLTDVQLSCHDATKSARHRGADATASSCTRDRESPSSGSFPM